MLVKYSAVSDINASQGSQFGQQISDRLAKIWTKQQVKWTKCYVTTFACWVNGFSIEYL